MEFGEGTPAVTGTVYLTQDQLGSTRLTTNAVGSVVGCHDYLPFGQEVPQTWGRSGVGCYGQSGETNVRFTGIERDAETGLDHYPGRYGNAALGRFMTPDPAGNFVASVGNPQSWNMYSYGLNSPLVYVDPSGLNPCENGVNPTNGSLCSVTVSGGDPGDSGGIFQGPGGCYGYSLDGIYLGNSCSGNPPKKEGATTAPDPPQLASLVPNFSFLQDVDWRKLGRTALSCTAEHYGLTGLAAGVGALGVPIPKTWVLGRTAALRGASDTMSFASAIEFGLFRGAGPRLATPLLNTTRVFGVIGRAAPVVSAALFAYDAASIGYCVYQGSK